MNFLKKLFSRRKDEPREPPVEFLQPAPPDWLLALEGQGMPEGDAFSIRVSLNNTSRTGRATTAVTAQKPGSAPATASGDLGKVEVDRFFVILGFSFPEEIQSVPSGALDGLPVSLAIHCREPFVTAAADCNLASWIGAKKTGPPVVEISRLLHEIQQRLLPTK